VQELIRLVSGKCNERHVVRDPGVVDEHREIFGGADLRKRLDTGVCAEIGDDSANCHVWELVPEHLQAIASSTGYDEVVSLVAEPTRESLANP
jgi:hypothetical protein